MKIHIQSTDPDEVSFETVRAETGDTLFVSELETFSVLDENEAPLAFSTRWVGDEVIVELVDGNWFSVIGWQHECSDSAMTDHRSAVSLPLAAEADFDSASLMSAVRIGGQKLMIGNPYRLETGATVTLTPDARLSYDPNGVFDALEKGQTARDYFSYTVSDQAGGFLMETVTISVVGELLAPEIVDVRGDCTMTDCETPIDIFLLDESTKSQQGEALQVIGVDQPESGAFVLVNADGSLSYDPRGIFAPLTLGETMTDTFCYALEDGAGGTETATIHVVIAEENTFSEIEAEQLAADAAPVEIEEVMAPLFGSMATLNADGSIAYDSNTTFDSMNAATAEDADPEAVVTFCLNRKEGKIERTEVMAPLLGAIATLNTDGSIDYTTDSEVLAPVSEGEPVAAPSSFLMFPPPLAQKF